MTLDHLMMKTNFIVVNLVGRSEGEEIKTRDFEENIEGSHLLANFDVLRAELNSLAFDLRLSSISWHSFNSSEVLHKK